MLLLSTTDVIFTLGEEPSEPKMYVVVSGTLEYTDSYGEVAQVGEKRCIAEAVLWTNWKHRGTLCRGAGLEKLGRDVERCGDCSRFEPGFEGKTFKRLHNTTSSSYKII